MLIFSVFPIRTVPYTLASLYISSGGIQALLSKIKLEFVEFFLLFGKHFFTGIFYL
jgi:hypothetical protein